MNNWLTQKLRDLLGNFNINTISLMWLIFSVLFLIMAVRELIKSRKGLDVENINLGFFDLNKAYETTRKAIIEADKSSHMIAAASYFLAALTVVASLIISLL